MRFHNQVVLITGAARGQGRAHALAFAREGAHLVLCDTIRQYATVPYDLSAPEELALVAREIKAMGQRVIAMHADVTDLGAMQQMADMAMAQIGSIDIAVANAGLYSLGPTWAGNSLSSSGMRPWQSYSKGCGLPVRSLSHICSQGEEGRLFASAQQAVSKDCPDWGTTLQPSTVWLGWSSHWRLSWLPTK